MLITRKWAMPSSNTFSIKPIGETISKYLEILDSDFIAIDPFVRNSPFKKICRHTNDLDSTIDAEYNIDALEFLKSMESNYADIIFFDPPYSPRQVSECYKNSDKAVNMETTQSSFGEI